MSTNAHSAHTARYHSAYSEPHAVLGRWTAPPLCHPSRAAAEERIEALRQLAGPGADSRRQYMIRPCDGSCRSSIPTVPSAPTGSTVPSIPNAPSVS